MVQPGKATSKQAVTSDTRLATSVCEKFSSDLTPTDGDSCAGFFLFAPKMPKHVGAPIKLVFPGGATDQQT